MFKKTINALLAGVVAVTGLVAMSPAPAEVSEVEVAETVTEYRSVETTYYLRRDDCGAGDADNPHLSRVTGSDSEGCGFIAGPVNEALHQAGQALSEEFPQTDGAGYLLDTEGKVAGQITVGNWTGLDAISAGYLIADIKITASNFDAFAFPTLVEVTEEVAMVPGSGAPVIEFEAEIDDSLAGIELTDLLVSVTLRGANGLNFTVAMSGDSFFSFPRLEPVEAA